MNQANFMMAITQYVCDTHTLVWFLTDDKRLGSKAKKIIEQAQSKAVGIQILIPIVVLMEMLSIAEKKNINIALADVLEFIEFHESFKICPANIEVFKEMMETSPNLELHDRAIVAIAALNNALILTKDEKIKKVYKKTVW